MGDYFVFFLFFSFPRLNQSLGTTSGSPTLPSDCRRCLARWLAPADRCLGTAFGEEQGSLHGGRDAVRQAVVSSGFTCVMFLLGLFSLVL